MKKILFTLFFVFLVMRNAEAGICNLTQPINSTSLSSQIITTTSSRKITLCTVLLISADAKNMSLVEGTGAVCATSRLGLIGGSTESLPLAANAGFAIVNDRPVIPTQVTGNNVCLLQSTTGVVSGVIVYGIN